jgi:hypothetical protein
MSPIEIKHQHMMNNLNLLKWFPESDTLPQVARVLFPSKIKSPEFPYTKYLIVRENVGEVRCQTQNEGSYLVSDEQWAVSGEQ